MTKISAEEIKRVKGMGFLNNRGTDEFSMRVITENGVLTAAQMKNLTEVAEKYGNGRMALTSRMTGYTHTRVLEGGTTVNEVEA